MDQFQTFYQTTADSPNITTAISQQFLIENVDLGSSYLLIPNSIFASLPLIYKHPENLRYSNGKQANREIMHEMLLLAHFLPDTSFEFQFPSGESTEIVFPAGTSLFAVLSRILPELVNSYHFLFFVRTQKKTGQRLLVRPSSLPIGIFDMPNCIWSIEFIYVPDYLKYNQIYINMLIKWFKDRKDQCRKEKVDTIKEFDDFITNLRQITNQEQLVNFLNKVNQTSSAKIRRYETSSLTIKLDWGKDYGKDEDHQIVKIKSDQKPLIGFNLSSARIRKENNQYIFSIKMIKDPKIVKTFKLTSDDANKLVEFFNISVIPKKAEKNPENALSLLFVDPSQRQFSIPQITSQSKIVKMKLKNVKSFVREQRNISKKHGKFGWKDDEYDDDNE